MKRTAALATMSSLLLTGCSIFTPSSNQIPPKTDMDAMMREHCEQMPGMRGCEKYLNEKTTQTPGMENHGMMMMDHASMVTSEEAFVVNMIPHHQEAVDTARLVVAKGNNPELKKLAQNIITAQEKEITMMNDWVKKSNYTLKPLYKNMMGDGTKLSGDELDRWFLMGMIMHHMGALQMAEAVIKLNPSEKILDFARAIIKNQSTEIEEMRSMLGMNGGMMTR